MIQVYEELKSSFDARDINDYQYLLSAIGANIETGLAKNELEGLINTLNFLIVLYEFTDVKPEKINLNNILDCQYIITEILKELKTIGNISETTITILHQLHEAIDSKAINPINITYEQTDILKTISPHINSNYLKEYLLYKNQIENKCCICGLNEWQNELLPMKLDFLDGNPYNQELNNIRVLCPNCFSQVGHV